MSTTTTSGTEIIKESITGTLQASELLVVDPGVEDVGALLAGARDGIEILYLSAAGDGLGQIARHLATRETGLQGLHVLAHGEPGALHLAGERIDSATLDGSIALDTIANAMDPSAAVMIYGCSLGAAAEGRRFVDHLSARLGVQVVTATGPVGSAVLGGDWNAFDHSSVAVAFSPASRTAWRGLLAQVNLTLADDNLNPGIGDDEFIASISNSWNPNDSLDGGAGNDTLTISAAQTVTLGATALVNIERVNITTGVQAITTNDASVATGLTLTVDASASSSNVNWNGSAESDGHFAITTGGGRDTIIGGALADTISTGDGNDTVSGRAGDDVISGGGGNDTLSGGDGADTIYGGADNDFLYGAAGDDSLFGGDGNDGVSGGEGDDTLSGGAGNDTLMSSSGNDVARGGAGKDWIWGQKGDDVLSGGVGDDTISGGDGADTLYGGEGNDTHSGGSGTDVIRGGEGSDLLLGMAQADTLSGGAGADTMSGGADVDLLIGGTDADVFLGNTSEFNGDTISDFSAEDQIVIKSSDLSSLNGTATSGTLSLGGGQEITLTGITATTGTFSATYDGTNTTITYTAAATSGGSGGGGTVDTSTPNTVVITPATPTVATFTEAETLSNTGNTGATAALLQNTGNNGNVVTAILPRLTAVTSEGPQVAQTKSAALDTLIQSIDSRQAPDGSVLTSHAQTYLNRLGDSATLDVRTIVPTTTDTTLATPIFLTGTGGTGQTEAFVVDMRSLPTGSTIHLDNIEFASVIGTATVAGGLGSNFLTGDENNQRLELGADNDTAFGGGGIDVLYGNGADDVLYGNQADDTMFGGQGTDTLYGGQDNDVVNGNAASDILYGNFGNDTLAGGADNDGLYGGTGDDSIVGGDGDDALYGGKASTDGAADTLSGGTGDDSLYGGEGVDYLYGGDGADRFVIEQNNGYDVILDFDAVSGDQIQIQANANGTQIDTFAELLANARTVDGNTEINLGDDFYVRLVGVQADQLQESWFGFF